MEKMIICGGRPLTGTVEIHGAKNSILPILAACVLCPDRCVITRCPEISDLHTAMRILEHLGCRAEMTGSALVVEPGVLDTTEIPADLMRQMRASVNFLGALLGRLGRCTLSLPGGCSLGSRPIDYHVAALAELGVVLEEDGDRLCFSWPKPRGGEIFLPFPSVGATENVVMAAVAVPDTVVLHNAAKEPEVVDLCRFLSSMGAAVEGVGTGTITIRGGRPLHGTAYAVLGDRIETATYLAMAAACGGRIRLKGTDAALLSPVLEVLRRAGCEIDVREREILLTSAGELCAVGEIETAAYPGFPTDAQAPVVAALLRARGETRVREQVFGSRFQYVEQLRKFGADISVSGSTALVRGVRELNPAEARATDLRGGAGVIIAGLQAAGQSTIENVHFVRRGYAELSENLQRLGAVVYDR